MEWIKKNLILVTVVLIVLLVIVYKRSQKGIPILSLRSSAPDAEEKQILSKLDTLNNLTANSKTGVDLENEKNQLLKFYREASTEEKQILNDFLDNMSSIFKAASGVPDKDFQSFFSSEITKFENSMYSKYGKAKMAGYREKLDKYAIDL